MRRSWQLLAVACALLSGSMALAEGPILFFWRDLCRSTARNNAWPDPFVPADRCAVRTPLEIVANNGWRYNNILADQYFNEAGQLNEAGDERVRTIFREFPTGRRMVFVLQSNDPVVLEARMASVYQAANKYILPGDVPQVGQTTIRPEGWPASYVVATDRALEENRPPPILPPRSGTTTSSSGS